MRVIQELAPDQRRDIVRIPDFFPQRCQHRLQIKQVDRITAVDHRRDGTHDQLQPIGELIACDFPLVQLQLMQDSFQPLLADPVLHHLLQCGLDQLLQRFLVLGLAALDSAHKGHLAVGILQATHWRRRAAQVGGLQRTHQRRGAVFQQHRRQQLTFHVLQQIKAVAQ